MAKGLIDGSLHVEGWEAFDKALDFDKRPIRRAMHKLGKLIVGDAQMMLVLGGDDSPYPVRRTGSLARALQYRVSPSGFMMKAAPVKPSGASDYYPAYLHYGVRMGARRKKNHRAQAPVGAWRIKPRENYMVDALEGRKDQAHSVLSAALERGFKYKKT
ncbi:hypothetical protein A9J41_14110 [Laribacter hongkongensis]|uniref:hypothetical protein n=1 Tax=Laribacter hongkongensis TaxID=168471 RepID=UPI0018781807|nr:hypothetical protein [Laribacter hongkongensis]MBE5528872.1 hypothetical protein [Laribacter hongkongensis]